MHGPPALCCRWRTPTQPCRVHLGYRKPLCLGLLVPTLMQSKGLNEGKGIPTEVLRSGCAGSHFHDRKSLGPRPLLWELQGLRACVPEAAFPDKT